jgi:hypothetical protein
LNSPSIEQWSWDLKPKAHGADAEASKSLKQRHKELWTHNGSGPDRFLTISFAGARFADEAIFSGRTFARAADFNYTSFYYPPDFDGVINASQIDLTGAYIGIVPPGRPHWTFRSSTPIRLRALRKIAEDTKNHDLERDLYIEEPRPDAASICGKSSKS